MTDKVKIAIQAGDDLIVVKVDKDVILNAARQHIENYLVNEFGSFRKLEIYGRLANDVGFEAEKEPGGETTPIEWVKRRVQEAKEKREANDG